MSDTTGRDRSTLNRRQMLRLSTAAGMGAAVPHSSADAAQTATARRRAAAATGVCSTPRSAVASTQYGKVRGYVEDGVLTFKGVPYGATTAGENRWLPARPPTPWEGELPTLIYGANCPQRLHDWVQEQSFLYQWTDGWQSEDMLKLNVWTSGLTGSRPVMVYFHGGGFAFGSAYELASQDGAQQARHHDVVSVTVNHRLNILGFLDLSEFGGPAYAESANVGMTDLVAALRWVRDNIASFGGDPNRVMIYGQSGGGSKVTTLLGMPSAQGLIHRASVQSGGGGNPPSAEQSRELTRRLVAELGVKDMAALQKMDWARLNAAGNAVVAAMNPPPGAAAGPIPPAGSAPRVGFGPTVDGRVVTMRSFFEGAPAISRDIPLLIGSVTEEGNRMSSRPTEAEWMATLARSYGEGKATAIAAALKRAYPNKSIRTLSYMCSGGGLNGLAIRNNVVRMATMKHAQGGAPVYAWYFGWQSPMLEDAGAWHTAELAFCFDNTARCAQGTGNGPEAQALARRMATAWANFARTGNPSQPGLPWQAFTPERGQTMVFDDPCRMVDDPDGEARKLLLT
ncbi:carboxylic ester hydrolase [Luteitalea sp. TBR-22]|uniref:carboxylesterase/lipase family protein n=1 Tax=Luteitalea sp. TBR-22 TaxID=2802971 RepID=UPI001AF5575D|nr:carboxylesterase family protein [Luteitalea sp. TBR-22]BCS31708.1 carboxylic ester hydrolase [Luteitalea sp. TBR-22]